MTALSIGATGFEPATPRPSVLRITANAAPALTTKWRKYTVTLKAAPDVTPSDHNHFVILAQGPSKGSIWLSLVSLMPPTFHDTPNGNRIDLMQKLADLQPAFLRLPGGNYLEGNTIAERFNWKTTLGPLENRPGHQCPWGYRPPMAWDFWNISAGARI